MSSDEDNAALIADVDALYVLSPSYSSGVSEVITCLCRRTAAYCSIVVSGEPHPVTCVWGSGRIPRLSRITLTLSCSCGHIRVRNHHREGDPALLGQEGHRGRCPILPEQVHRPRFQHVCPREQLDPGLGCGGFIDLSGVSERHWLT